jgi:hypothetical protein
MTPSIERAEVSAAAAITGLTGEMLAASREHGRHQGWSRLEVTTPPLPAFSRTASFYEREGFAVSGGRKLRCLIGGGPEP